MSNRFYNTSEIIRALARAIESTDNETRNKEFTEAFDRILHIEDAIDRDAFLVMYDAARVKCAWHDLIDRSKLAHVLLSRGHAINANFTKIYKRAS